MRFCQRARDNQNWQIIGKQLVMPNSHNNLPGFGPFCIDLKERVLFRDGNRVGLRDQAFSALKVLFERRNQLVSYEELKKLAWPGTNVERHTIQMTVGEIRRALEDEPEKWIKTSSKLGYTLVCPEPVLIVATLGEIAADRMKMHSRRALIVSIRHYTEVLKAGPNAEAYGELAKAYLNLGHTGLCGMLPQEAMPLVRKIIVEALEHFPELPAAYACRGLANLIYDFDWHSAYEDLRLALALNPDVAWAHCFLAHMEISQGRFESGLHHARRGAELDPTTPMTVFTVPFMLLFSGRADEAVREAAHYLEVFDPFPIGNILHGYALEAIGATRRAIAEYERSLGIDFFPDALARLGHAHGTIGHQKRALEYLEALHEAEADGTIAYLPGYLEALVHVGLGNNKEALKCLENSVKQKCDWLIYLTVEPSWKPLTIYKRFNMLLERVGLVKAGYQRSAP
jgi:DNA-binding winged helix-turn-helix (wHTH) protein